MQRTEHHTRSGPKISAVTHLTSRKTGQAPHSFGTGGRNSLRPTRISQAIKQENYMTLSERYDLYLELADDGKGNDITSGKVLKTFDEWLSS